MKITVKLLKDVAGVPQGTIKSLPLVLAKEAEAKGLVEIIGDKEAPQNKAEMPEKVKTEAKAKKPKK